MVSPQFQQPIGSNNGPSPTDDSGDDSLFMGAYEFAMMLAIVGISLIGASSHESATQSSAEEAIQSIAIEPAVADSSDPHPGPSALRLSDATHRLVPIGETANTERYIIVVDGSVPDEVHLLIHD